MTLTTEERKELDCLLAWREFYKQNHQFESFDKAQKQLDEFHNVYR